MSPELSICGYTEREGQFLELVATWSGYFLPRQFQAFIARRPGATTDVFLKRLVANTHALVTTLTRNTHLYHLSSRPLYNALRQENNRHRRRRPPYQIRTKLMTLDFVLANPTLNFLPTEGAKVSFFSSLGIPAGLLPRKRYTSRGLETVRYFVDKMPVFTTPDTGTVSFAFVDGGAFCEGALDRFFTEHASLFGALSEFGLVYVTSREAFATVAKSRCERFFNRASAASDEASAAVSQFQVLKKRFDGGGLGELTMDELRELKHGLKRYGAASSLAITARPQCMWSVAVLPYSYDLFGDL